jgi:glucosamine 6-phosphate synthetase-like amidotransferase/phosphosugar isomerase protein
MLIVGINVDRYILMSYLYDQYSNTNSVIFRDDVYICKIKSKTQSSIQQA